MRMFRIKMTAARTNPQQIREVRIDSEKSRRLLGWAPHTALPEGLRRTMAFYRSLDGGASAGALMAGELE